MKAFPTLDAILGSMECPFPTLALDAILGFMAVHAVPRLYGYSETQPYINWNRA